MWAQIVARARQVPAGGADERAMVMVEEVAAVVETAIAMAVVVLGGAAPVVMGMVAASRPVRKMGRRGQSWACWRPLRRSGTTISPWRGYSSPPRAPGTASSIPRSVLWVVVM